MIKSKTDSKDGLRAAKGMRAATRKENSTGKRIRRWIIPALLLAMILACFLYTADYYRADAAALQAMESNDIRITRTSYGWYFDGPSETDALVFYPGGKVEETAYAPLLSRLAENGIDVCLVKMPFHLAIFGVNAAERVMKEHAFDRWYIGGHSLGGAMAAAFAEKHDLDGVVLLAAYPTGPVEEPMLMLYGSEDGVLNRDRLSAAAEYGDVEKHVLDGGNHAQFGNYGPQKGDGSPAITAEEQQDETVRLILEWMENTEEKETGGNKNGIQETDH